MIERGTCLGCSRVMWAELYHGYCDTCTKALLFGVANDFRPKPTPGADPAVGIPCTACGVAVFFPAWAQDLAVYQFTGTLCERCRTGARAHG